MKTCDRSPTVKSWFRPLMSVTDRELLSELVRRLGEENCSVRGATIVIGSDIATQKSRLGFEFDEDGKIIQRVMI